MRQAVKFFSFSTSKTQFTKNEVFLILIVFHISGVFTAAFDTQMEWLTIKGIADFADGEQVHAESWKACASVMAASLVSHLLSDPGVFRSWPHYPGVDYCQFSGL